MRKYSITGHFKKYAFRNEAIISMLESGDYTLEQVGSCFGISRERVRQLYKKNTGSNFAARAIKSKIKRIENKQKLLERVKFKCRACGKEVTNGEGHRQRWLCTECGLLTKKRNLYVWKTCKTCGKKFHPHRSIGFPSQRGTGDYCSVSCYMSTGIFGPKLGPRFPERNRRIHSEFVALYMGKRVKVYKLLSKKYKLSFTRVGCIVCEEEKKLEAV